MMMYDYYGYYDLINVIENVVGNYSLVGFIMAVFKLVIAYLLLRKTDEKPWKAFIPVYSKYIEYKLYWNVAYFWLSFIIPIIASIFGLIFIADSSLFIFMILACIMCLLLPILGIILNIKKAKCFGESTLFGVGLLFFNTIFVAILALDKNYKYLGNNEYKDDNFQEN